MKTSYTVYIDKRAVDTGVFVSGDDITTRDILEKITTTEVCADTGKKIQSPLCDGMTVRLALGEWYIRLNGIWWELVALP